MIMHWRCQLILLINDGYESWNIAPGHCWYEPLLSSWRI